MKNNFNNESVENNTLINIGFKDIHNVFTKCWLLGLIFEKKIKIESQIFLIISEIKSPFYKKHQIDIRTFLAKMLP